MSNLVIIPILLPLFSAVLMLLFTKNMKLTRAAAAAAVLLNTAYSAFLVWKVYSETPIVLETGGWKAPYGIILVADYLSVLLVLAANIVTAAAVFYSFHTLNEKLQKFYFYPLTLLLLTGVSGAFITGDLFNLFVFFEVLLMASYALIILGGTKQQFRESLKYIILNLFSSILFVTTVSFLYSVTGTVNMAQLAQRVAEVEQQGVLTGIGILLFVVFATKGALFPLFFWLPRSYIAPAPVISALFGALLTKVGIYSILRVFSLIFVHKLELTHSFFLILAALTMLAGVIGALSTHNVKLIIAYNILPAIGFMMLGIGTFSAEALAGTVYYLLHDMGIKAALFFLVGLLTMHAGTSDLRKMGGYIHSAPVLGWMFFLSCLVLAGLPPFSGFIGKLILLKSAMLEGHYIVSGIGLFSSLLILFSVIRIFIGAFWGEHTAPKQPVPKTAAASAGVLLTLGVFMGIGAEWIYPWIQVTGDWLYDPSGYIDSVLKEGTE
ncbi:Na+/H+ antiporter subunit D [Fictibacillus iocasae]|uniref:Na+/H+ antiporter subunit D n=1 Tax=Fictibacillus iocasae TaxID=2715437 RepID=A0ABW2NTM9_9BACL